MAARMTGQIQPQPKQTKVALIVPLSGKSAALGQAMVNAAQLAVYDSGGAGFELMPRDTSGTPDGALKAYREAVASGANLIIGPLFATEVAAIKPEAHSANIGTLALSTDVSLAEPGVFVMGFAPTPQVERVIGFAARQGARRFAALIPSGPYGQIVNKAFEAAVRQNGGELVASEGVNAIQALATKKDQIDALFLPFGGEQARRLAGQLAAAGFDRSRLMLLGTGLWDEPNTAQGQPFLVGGLYAAAEPDARQRFMEAYKETYGQTPPRLATLAYDATALAAILVKNGAGINSTTLTNPSGFAGLDGLFRLTANGQIERGLAISELTPTGSRMADPAPVRFTER